MSATIETTETPQEAARRLAGPWLAQGYRPAGLHEYTDASGAPIYWKVRLKRPGTGEKWIRPMHHNGAGYVLGEPSFPGGKPLYRLHELATAPPEQPVWWVEGEACADALARLRVLATTAGGAQSDDRADFAPLRGRHVIVWPDHDTAGCAHGERVAARLLAIGRTVETIDVEALGLPAGGDVVDWLAARAGATAADVEALARVPQRAHDMHQVSQRVHDMHPVSQRAHDMAPGGAVACTDEADAEALVRAHTVAGDPPQWTPADAGGWPTPGAIGATLKPVPAFEAETLLPRALCAWIVDEAERMPCPVEFVAASALVALGSVIGARCAIRPKARDPWQIVPNLWGGIVGEPAAKKSPAWGAALKPLDRLVAQALEDHRAELVEYETAKVVFDAQKDAIEGRIKEAAKRPTKGDPAAIACELRAHVEQGPVAPTLRRYKSNDTTVEKLGELLRDNPAGLLVLRDELVGLFATWDREGREGDRAFFLEAWNGDQSYDTDRIGRGHIAIPNLCASIFGGIQPDKLVTYLEQATHAFANDGMLQRFQVLLYPDPRRWEWRDRAPNKAVRDAAYTVFEQMAEFDPVAWGAEPANEFAKFPWFHFDDEAQAVFIEWAEDLHCKRIPAEDSPIIRQHLSKFDKLFPALALIFHLVDCAGGTRGPVTRKAALRAAAWCEVLEAHARRCYGLLQDDGLRAAQALAAKLERGALEDGFTLRDVRRHQWRNLTTDEACQAALDWLEEEHWLRGAASGGTGPGSGRRTVRYQINPSIRGGSA